MIERIYILESVDPVIFYGVTKVNFIYAAVNDSFKKV